MKTSFIANNQHLTEEGIALYVDALRLKRTSELPDDMRSHVEGCPDCQLQIVESHEMLKMTPYPMNQPHPYFDRKVTEPSVYYTAYKVAAVVGTVAILGAGYYFLSGNNSDPSSHISLSSPPSTQPVMQAQDSVRIPKNASTALLADNFTESVNLEDLVHGEFRSQSIEVLSPVIGGIVKSPIVFSWNNINVPVTIQILNNKEKVLLSVPVKGNTYVAKRKFAQGLYYWKLETKDEMVFVGKFLIK